jgi:4-amino-4-deoxy-L-arabinose transferase-like glycosyltransferase
LRAVKRDQRLLLGILVAAAALRIFWNNVSEYSPADEKIYTDYTRFFLDHSYRELVRLHLGESWRWVYPNPLRWGYFLLTALTCKLTGHCDERSLAWLATVAGVACVWLTWALGKKLVSREVGLVAAALTATSPLQLALGRRALQDEVFCAAVLLALLAFLDDDDRPRRHILAVAALSFAFAVKETAFLLYPALAVFTILAIRRRGWRRSDVWVLALPPAVHFVGFVLLTRLPGDYFTIMSVVANAVDAPYAARYQAGPPHRILFDFFMLAPLVWLLAVAALARMSPEPGMRLLALYTVVMALVFAAVTSKNIRYAVMLDPALRILAASLLALLPGRRLAAALAAVAVSELWLFHAVFIAGKVYDPVTDNLLRALGAIP